MACQDPAQKNTTEKIEIKDTAIRKAPDLDSLLVETKKLREDILQHLDSTTIEGKAAILLARLKDSADYAAIHGRDTLMDLNGDKQADLLLEFYAAAGTGLKNGVNIYMFDKRSNRFVTEPVDLPNPTFNFKNNTVVSYYIAMGAGYATELKWDRLTLDTLESIEVENDWHKPFKSTATIHNHITGKNTRKISDAIWLPAKYRYFDYQPLIRRE
ncbi:MAG TPA: hypothetical protein VFI06_10180 [Chitinophagaceae bacterium]|nr:hypothetical protein [Chitinophagaceae bacterium]